MAALIGSELRDEVSKNLGGRGGSAGDQADRIDRHLNMAQVRIARAHDFTDLYRVDTDTVSPGGTDQTTLSGAEAQGQTVLSVVSSAMFLVGDTAEVTLTSGALHLSVISAVADSTSITLADSLPSAAASGKKVRNVSATHPDALYTGLPSTLKDIFSLMYREAGDDSRRKLTWIPQRQWDQLIQSSSSQSSGNVTHYTRWGTNRLEWYKTPSDDFLIERRYSVWPSDLVDGTESELKHKDDLIIAWATELMFHSTGMRTDGATWFAIRSQLLRDSISEDRSKPDIARVPLGASEAIGTGGINYWQDPFVKRQP